MIPTDFWNLIESATKNPAETNFLSLLQQLDRAIQLTAKPDKLSAAGSAIEQLANIYRDRATATFSRIQWDSNPQQEPIIALSEFDRYVRQSSVLDLDRFLVDRSHYYPLERLATVTAAQISEIQASIVDAPLPPDPDVAHEEDISTWVQETIDALGSQPQSLMSLAQHTPLVRVLLSIFLSDNKLVASRTSGDFYDRLGIVVKLT
jgi:hypothetical protein